MSFIIKRYTNLHIYSFTCSGTVALYKAYALVAKPQACDSV